MRRILLAAFAAFVMIIGSPKHSFASEAGFAEAYDPFPSYAASYLVKVEGETLWARLPDNALPPASLTKIMTAHLTLKHSALDEIATVSRAATREKPVKLYLRRGEKIRVGDLLAATLLKSANDACHALADHVAGSEAKFVKMMNREAARLGMKNTHFANACGFDNPRHYSTANDLALLAEVAMENPVFSDIVTRGSRVIKTINTRRTFRLVNKNGLVGHYPGAIDVKTGFTRRAGKCLIAIAERDGRKVLLVLLNSPNRWGTAAGMLELALAGYAEDAGPVVEQVSEESDGLEARAIEE